MTEGFATLEQGLKLFDELARAEVTIVSEGRNSNLIKCALEHFNISGVEVLNGVEKLTGKNQLSTLFDFFSSTPHERKVLFVWDCDVNHKKQEQNNTFPYRIPKNSQNSLAETGIENAFPESVFEGFVKTTSLSDGKIIKQFDETRKRDFESHVVNRNNPDDFVFMKCLIDEIERVKNA